jgi:hypothetical protein
MKNLIFILNMSLACATYANADALDKITQANPSWTPFQRLQDFYDHATPVEFSQIPFVTDPSIKGTACVTANKDKEPRNLERKSVAIVRVLGKIVTPGFAGHPDIPADPGQQNPNGPLFPNVGAHPEWPAVPPTPEKVEMVNAVITVSNDGSFKKTEEELGKILKSQKVTLTFYPGVVQTYESAGGNAFKKVKVTESYRISDGLLTKLTEIEGQPNLTTYTYCFKAQ